MLSFKSDFLYSPLSLSSRVSLVPLYFLPLKWHHLIAGVIDISPECLFLQQCWFCEIPQIWTRPPLTMKWTVPQNSFEMLLLVSCSDGCHFNASPNELRSETCQPLECQAQSRKNNLSNLYLCGTLFIHNFSLLGWLFSPPTFQLPLLSSVLEIIFLATHLYLWTLVITPANPLSAASSYLLLPLLHQTTILPLSELYLGLIFNHKWTSSFLYLKLGSKCLRTLRGIRKAMHLLQ